MKHKSLVDQVDTCSLVSRQAALIRTGADRIIVLTPDCHVKMNESKQKADRHEKYSAHFGEMGHYWIYERNLINGRSRVG